MRGSQRIRTTRLLSLIALALGLGWAGGPGCAALSGRSPAGGASSLAPADAEAIAALGTRLQGRVVWASSRYGNHDLLMMDPAKNETVRLTSGEHVDWFPRFAPDGQRILFTRSKRGWVSERDANRPTRWDLFIIKSDGSEAHKVVDNASWGSWLTDERIIFSRATKVYAKALGSGDEELLLDSEAEEQLGSADLQQPQLSPDGRYLAITLRGSRRETGVWDREVHKWTATGKGCQINWFPSGRRIVWVNPSGNGGSEVLSMHLTDDEPWDHYEHEDVQLIDLPGRRSHEYFPQLSDDGKWLVWGATQRGHDHDIADYEIYAWQVGEAPETATRLTFHSGNDRWPDVTLKP